MKTYTVCAAFYDQDNRATVTVKAKDFADACEKVIKMIDRGEVSTHLQSFDPVPTFVYGVVEGRGDPFTGAANVPAHLTQETVMGGERSKPRPRPAPRKDFVRGNFSFRRSVFQPSGRPHWTIHPKGERSAIRGGITEASDGETYIVSITTDGGVDDARPSFEAAVALALDLITHR
ncbi:hypothetical protein MesoLjLc_51330 [Mesorhizobium sp. L-8-10]|uniref:hypothetical protein n=1 Tax=Mesorhizobium sp. L-8-10 TaxID=2744523 RepID=UPI001925F20C|nr:hypothetical protein [Mesorhizobium sp. L-8-10]BCH33203.1 hypothetical protein MesoLjLc_51330 [Mesorhizobium sp. L-8-10]